MSDRELIDVFNILCVNFPDYGLRRLISMVRAADSNRQGSYAAYERVIIENN